jgi:hypothetical protein
LSAMIGITPKWLTTVWAGFMIWCGNMSTFSNQL